jgi:hypothetical protein
MLHTDIPHDFRCIFDNTALGAATADAFAVKSHLWDSQRVAR